MTDTNVTRLLFLGDIFGNPGRSAVKDHLPMLKEKLKLDFVIANSENATGGFGLNRDKANDIFGYGVDVATLGNHTWDQKDVYDMLQHDKRILRPINYPPGTVGKGYRVFTMSNGKRIAVVNMLGRLFMEPYLDCPFQASRELQRETKLGDDYDIMLVDVHAETTSEKRGLGYIWDGKASLVVGTHTHVPTADAHVMEKGTGFHTDTGMCGTFNSCIGLAFESTIPRFERKGKFPFQASSKGEPTLCATYAEIGDDGLCKRIEMVRVGGLLQESIPEL